MIQVLLAAIQFGGMTIEAEAIREGVGPDDVQVAVTNLADGTRVENCWSEVRDRRFRLEQAVYPDGTVEITHSSQVEWDSPYRRRRIEVLLPHEAFDGKAFRAVTPVFVSFSETNGVFGAQAVSCLKTRFLAVDGALFDFNPMGAGDILAGGGSGVWKHMDSVRGAWEVRRTDRGWLLSVGSDVGTSWGGYCGAKLVIRKGRFEDFDTLHSHRFYNWYFPFLECEYKGAPGWYFVTTEKREGTKLRRRTEVKHLGGDSHGQECPCPEARYQFLMADAEDYSFNRGFWVSEGYEPSEYHKSSDFRGPFKPTSREQVIDLSGSPCATKGREIPITQTSPASRTFFPRSIKRFFCNSSTMDELDAPGALEKYFDREFGDRSVDVIMLSGMLCRHAYTSRIEAGLDAVKRITAEAHRRGIKVMDHFDITLLMNVGTGFRVMAERIDELDAQVGSGLPSYQFCIMNPKLREAAYRYVKRDVENGVDGFQLDEVQFFHHGCECQYCREAFLRDTGRAMPADLAAELKKGDTPFVRTWKEWRIRNSTDFILELKNRLAPLNPDLFFSAYTTDGGMFYPYGPIGHGRDVYDLVRVVGMIGQEVMSRKLLVDLDHEFVVRRVQRGFALEYGIPIWNWFYNFDWRENYAGWAMCEMTSEIPLLSECPLPDGAPDFVRFGREGRGMIREGAESIAKAAIFFSPEERKWNPKRDEMRSNLFTVAEELERRHVPYDVISWTNDVSKYAEVYDLTGDPAAAVERLAATSPWKVEVPASVHTALWKEKGGAIAVHFYAKAPISKEVVFTLEGGCGFHRAVATSPDFAGERSLETRTDDRGTVWVRLPAGLLKTYTLVRVSPAEEPRPVNVPELLLTEDGEKVTTKELWESKRKGEIRDFFHRYVYGRRPVERPPHLRFSAAEPDRVMMDGRALRKRIRVEYGGGFGTNSFVFTAFLPTAAKRPVPATVFICNRDPDENIDPERVRKSGFWPAEEIVAKGFAAIAFHNRDITGDRYHGNRDGAFACFEKNEGDYRYPYDFWGVLSCWGWGASRVMDWIETVPSLINAKEVAVVGHSRGGKTALVAAVEDARFAMAVSSCSGCGGAKLRHIDLPESEESWKSIRARQFWYCQNYAEWANRDREMPYDQHEWVALIAPRLVCIGSATKDPGAGPLGERWTARLASPAWELYGKKGYLEDDSGSIHYHVREGGHDLTPYDWNLYLDFALRHGWGKEER